MSDFILSQAIVSADGELIYAKQDESLIGFFMARSKAQGGKVTWGDHYRVMKRRKDAREVVAKCSKTGEVLITNDRS